MILRKIIWCLVVAVVIGTCISLCFFRGENLKRIQNEKESSLENRNTDTVNSKVGSTEIREAQSFETEGSQGIPTKSETAMLDSHMKQFRVSRDLAVTRAEEERKKLEELVRTTGEPVTSDESSTVSSSEVEAQLQEFLKVKELYEELHSKAEDAKNVYEKERINYLRSRDENPNSK